MTLLSPAGRSNEHHRGGGVLLVNGTMARRFATVYTPNARQKSNERMARVGRGNKISRHKTDLRKFAPLASHLDR